MTNLQQYNIGNLNMSKIKDQPIKSKNNKSKPKEFSKLQNQNQIVQFNPYHKHFTEHLDNVIISLRRLTSIQKTPYSQIQKVSKDIFTSLKVNPNQKLKTLELLLNLIRFDSKYITLFKNKLLSLIIQQSEHIETNLANYAIQNYIKQHSKIINEIDIQIFFTKIKRYPQNSILWSILLGIIQHDNYLEPQIGEFFYNLVQYLHFNQVLQEKQLNTIIQFFKAIIIISVGNDRLKDINIFEIALYGVTGSNTKLFQLLINQIRQKWVQSQVNIRFIQQIAKMFSNHSIGSNNKYGDVQRLAVLIKFHQLFFIIIKYKFEVQKFNDKEIQQHLKNVFFIIQFCDRIKQSNKIQSLFQNIYKIGAKQISGEDILYAESQSILYTLLFEAEKAIPDYNLQLYSSFYIENPGIFQQSFFDNILKSCNDNLATKLMVSLIDKWIQSHQIRNFSLKNFIYRFIQNSVRKGGEQLTNMILGLSMSKVQALNLMIYKQSFVRDKPDRKMLIPKMLSSYQDFSSLTSCGMADDNIFIDRYFPIIRQNIIWRPILREIQKRNQFYIIKYFYNSLNSTFLTNNQARKAILNTLANKMSQNLKSNFQEVCASLHLILVLCINTQNQQFNKKMIQIFVQNLQRITDLLSQICKERTNCMKYMELSQQSVRQNMRKLEMCKRMNKLMLRNWIKFIDHCGVEIVNIIPKNKTLENFIEIITKISNQSEMCPFSIIRKLSIKCSSKRFINSASERLRLQSFTHIDYLVYRQIIFAQSESRTNQQYNELKHVNTQKILQICLSLLERQVDAATERQVLKSKLVCLETIKTFKVLCQKQTVLNMNFKKIYILKRPQINHLILRFMYKDNKLIAKFERQLITHIRCFILAWIFEDYKTNYEIMSSQTLWPLLVHLATDECFELRVLLVNGLFSQYKQGFRRVRYELHWCLSIATIIQVYDPQQKLKWFCKTIFSLFQNNVQIGCLVGLVVSFICSNLGHLIPPHTFLQQFCKIWLKNKETEFIFYLMVEQIEAKKLLLKKVIQSPVKSQISSYYIPKIGLDPKKNQSYSQNTDIIFQRIKQCIRQKPRSFRILKGKRQLYIEWNKIKCLGLLSDSILLK